MCSSTCVFVFFFATVGFLGFYHPARCVRIGFPIRKYEHGRRFYRRTSRILCKALCSLSLGKGFSDGVDWCWQAWMGKPLTPRILSKFRNLLVHFIFHCFIFLHAILAIFDVFWNDNFHNKPLDCFEVYFVHGKCRLGASCSMCHELHNDIPLTKSERRKIEDLNGWQLLMVMYEGPSREK